MRRRERKDELIYPKIVAPDAPKPALPKRNTGFTNWCVWGAFLLGLLGWFCVQYEVTACSFGNPPPGTVPECGSHPFFTLGFLLIGCAFLCLLLAGAAWVRGRHDKSGWFGKSD